MGPGTGLAGSLPEIKGLTEPAAAARLWFFRGKDMVYSGSIPHAEP